MWTRAFPVTLKVGALLAFAYGVPALAQTVPISMSPFAGGSSEDSTANTSYPYGESEKMARGMASAVQMAQQKHDLCWQYGCLVIANTSKNFRITEFRVIPPRIEADRELVNNSPSFTTKMFSPLPSLT